jgi:hypothetical protein
VSAALFFFPRISATIKQRIFKDVHVYIIKSKRDEKREIDKKESANNNCNQRIKKN